MMKMLVIKRKHFKVYKNNNKYHHHLNNMGMICRIYLFKIQAS